MKTLGYIFLALVIAVVLGVLIVALLSRDYEHESERCKNCMYRDDVLHYCWPRSMHVGTEEKACQFFKKREKI